MMTVNVIPASSARRNIPANVPKPRPQMNWNRTVMTKAWMTAIARPGASDFSPTFHDGLPDVTAEAGTARSTV